MYERDRHTHRHHMMHDGIYRACIALRGKNGKTFFSVGSQVMWESSVKKADAAAKSALSFSVTPMKLPATDMTLYPCITKLIFNEWQEVWNCCAGKKTTCY